MFKHLSVKWSLHGTTKLSVLQSKHVIHSMQILDVVLEVKKKTPALKSRYHFLHFTFLLKTLLFTSSEPIPGMVVRNVFRIRTFVQVHRTAFASHSHRIFRTFFAFSHFLIFLLYVLHLVHQNVVKIAKRSEKNTKKVRNANAMRKWNQNSHRTTTEKKFAFSHFFASHSHRTTIPDPYHSDI